MGSTAVHRKPPPSVPGWGQSLGPRWQDLLGLLGVRQASCWSKAPGLKARPSPFSPGSSLRLRGGDCVGATSQGRLGMGPSPRHVHTLFGLEFQAPTPSV